MILFSQNLLFQILLQPCLYHVMQIFTSVFQHIQTASHFRCRAEIPDCLFHPMILSAAVAEKRENSLSGQIICTQPGRYRRGNGTTPVGIIKCSPSSPALENTVLNGLHKCVFCSFSTAYRSDLSYLLYFGSPIYTNTYV